MPAQPEHRHPALIHVSRPAMGTEFEVLLPANVDREQIEYALEVLEWIQQMEAKLSIYREDSEVSRLNRSGQEFVSVSEDVFEVVESAITISRRTEGAFDITAGPLVEAWGFTDRRGRKPTEADLQSAIDRVGFQHLELDGETRRIRMMRPGMQINLGAIGKGFALDRAAAMMVTAGVDHFLIHGGNSSIVARGVRRQDEPGWPIALSHPIHANRRLGRVWLTNTSLSTSGSGKRFFHFRGKRMGHVIDPRTGHPTGGLLSLTLIAPQAGHTDALATGLFVLGIERLETFVQEDPARAAIAVRPGRRGNEVEVIMVGADRIWEPLSEDS